MLKITLIAAGLVGITVTIHAVGLAALLRAMMRLHARQVRDFWSVTLVVISLTCYLVLIHLLEIFVWGLFYYWQDCLPDVESALYFSGVTYTTVGYGDLVLPQAWRMFGPLEAMTGTLMFGLSTGVFFAIVHRWIVGWIQRETASRSHASAPKNK